MRNVLRQCVPVLLLALGLLSLPCVSAAQVLGTIAGTVSDASGAVLPGVTVEASSPALIEKTRTAVTDGAGQYRIVNLPPGTYAMTFTLTGFSTVRREGVNVSINITTNIDADLRVGDLKETITVSGETPVVDLQSAAQTTVADARTFKELPSGGSWVNIAQLVPAINSAFFGNRDVGGLQGDQTGTQVSVHGGIPGDGVSMIDGMRIGNMYLSSNLTNMSLSALIYDEVNISFSGQTPESGTNGVIMNAVPKSGGNQFHGSLLANGSAPSLQGSNVNDRLRARGASDTDSLKKLYDINGAIGGPIKRDRLWFYYTSRYFTNEYYMAGQYFPVDPAAFIRTPDLSRQAFAGTWTADNNIRLTWAPTVKQKISGWYAYQRKDDEHWLQQILFMSPEAAQLVKWPTQLSTITWTYTATNRVLVEAGFAPGESPDTIVQPLGNIAGVPIFELGGTDVPFNFAHRASWFNDYDDRLPSQTFKGSMSYVTGSHNFKVGAQMQRGHFERRDSNHAQADYYIVSLNGSPLLATITSPLAGWVDRLNYNLGIYAQDSWAMRRLTLSGGVRLDFQNESVDAYHYGPGPWLPNRSVNAAEIKNVPNWKDVNPRVNASYDVLGNGKTAI
ncbi:MAG TPA: carboxypeptidase regulatory-like domain-containing protein, partial [Vicinamibacterales bacterium]